MFPMRKFLALFWVFCWIAKKSNEKHNEERKSRSIAIAQWLDFIISMSREAKLSMHIDYDWNLWSMDSTFLFSLSFSSNGGQQACTLNRKWRTYWVTNARCLTETKSKSQKNQENLKPGGQLANLITTSTCVTTQSIHNDDLWAAKIL